jgi:T5SS/PEP-CTERM-associated repeat protein
MRLFTPKRSDNRSKAGRAWAGFVLCLTFPGAASHALAQCQQVQLELESVNGRLFIDPGNNVFGEEVELNVNAPGSYHLEFPTNPPPEAAHATVDLTIRPDGVISGTVRNKPFCSSETGQCVGGRIFASLGASVRVRVIGGPVRVTGTPGVHKVLDTDSRLDVVAEPVVIEETAVFETELDLAVFPPPSAPVVLELTGETTFSVTPVTVQPTTFVWTAAASDRFDEPDNWDPSCDFPHSGDTAQFIANGAGSSISAGNATAGRWVILTPIDLNGSARASSTSTTEPSLTLFNGGSLLLNDGATFESVNAALGTETAVLGSRITVSGDNSLWKNTGDATIGAPPEARLIIENGGRVENSDPNLLRTISLGKFAGTSGRVEVRGIQNSGVDPSSLLVNRLEVGNPTGDGFGNVLVENGGLLDAEVIFFNRGSMTIAGLNPSTNGRSTLKNTVTLVIASDPESPLEVKDGALLNTGSAVVGTGRILVNNTDSGLPPLDVSVPISGAAWIADGSITLDGQNGPAELIVDDNGVVICTGDINLGNDASNAGKITVLDGGSIGVNGALTVGGSGRGELIIEAGGRLDSGPATVGSGPDPNSRGVVVISAGLVSDAEWEVNGELTVGGGATATGLTFPEAIKGQVVLRDSQLFGEPTLSVTGHLFVFAQGAITGNGTLAVPPQRRVVNGGVIAPGLSPGEITIDGDYEQPEGGVLVIEVGGTEAGKFDVLHVKGNATLAGTVDLRFIDGFVPQAGDNVDFVVVDGTITGKLTGSTFIEAAGDPDSGQPAAQTEVKWEVTEEGTCRMTIIDVTALDDSGRPLLPGCGAGQCGAGAVPVMPLTFIGLATLKVSRRRCAR